MKIYDITPKQQPSNPAHGVKRLAIALLGLMLFAPIIKTALSFATNTASTYAPNPLNNDKVCAALGRQRYYVQTRISMWKHHEEHDSNWNKLSSDEQTAIIDREVPQVISAVKQAAGCD